MPNGTDSTDRIAEIRSRLDAAAPGPWVVHESPCEVRRESFTGFVVARTNHGEDANLIAHAPADIAYLLAEVERLAKRVRMYEVVKS